MPISVRIPERWVVRISAPDNLLMTALCRPMVNARNEQPVDVGQPGAHHAKTEKQHGFDHQRQRVLTVHASPPGEQRQHRRACRASDKREQCSSASQYRLTLPSTRLSAMDETTTVMCEV